LPLSQVSLVIPIDSRAATKSLDSLAKSSHFFKLEPLSNSSCGLSISKDFKALRTVSSFAPSFEYCPEDKVSTKSYSIALANSSLPFSFISAPR